MLYFGIYVQVLFPSIHINQDKHKNFPVVSLWSHVRQNGKRKWKKK